MATVRQLGRKFAHDKVVTLDEANALVAKAKESGAVTKATQAALKKVLTQYGDRFTPEARAAVQAVLNPTPGSQTQQPQTQPQSQSQSQGRPALVPLSVPMGQRPVYLTANGAFSVEKDGAPPVDDTELGEAWYRAAEAASDSATPMLADVKPEVQAAVLKQLQTVLARVPADGSAPKLEGFRAEQLRASAGTVLLDLVESAKTPELRQQAVGVLEKLVRAETDNRLRENLVFHFSNGKVGQSAEYRKLSDTLIAELTPTKPPYDKWFADGKNTVTLSWAVGEGEFWKGFTGYLKSHGFTPVGAENQRGLSTYEATIDKPGVGPTTFRIQVRENETDILKPMADPAVNIVGYDGHSNWGRNMSRSVLVGPELGDAGAGRLIFYNLCVGKGMLDRVKEKYGNAQVVTTFAASNFYTDAQGQMTRGEGVQALLALVDGIAARKGWPDIHQGMNRAADIGTDRTWDNYLTPISTQTRERVLDRDNDGQADYLDKHFNYSLFQVEEDTARELEPVRQQRHASVLDGTKVIVAANMVNTLSEFSGLLDRFNPDSKVVADGWFEPKLGDHELVRFSEQPRKDGKGVDVAFQVNARYSHMSEEMLRAIAVSEFTRWLANTGKLKLEPADAKLGGALAFAQSLDVDESFRDGPVWAAYLKRMNLPAELTFDRVTQALEAHGGHNYAGDTQSIAKLRSLLPQDVLDALAKPEVGVPTTLL